MTKIKICGLMQMEDVDAVNRCKPDYAGFVFAESRRRVTAAQARKMVERLDPDVVPVGVFVDVPAVEVAAVAAECRLGAVQLHGDEDRAYIEQIRKLLPAGTLVFKAIRVKDTALLVRAKELDCDMFLLDAWCENQMGGAGRTFNWELVRGFPKPFLLAGGLDCENVADAIACCDPAGVDVSSGVETAHKKDAHKIAAFIDTVRRQSL